MDAACNSVSTSQTASSAAHWQGPDPPKRRIDLSLPAPLEEGALYLHERFWRDHQKWLEEQGYMLRPRYRADWVPSWKGTKYQPKQCEDGIRSWLPAILDAKRASDGAIVILKRVDTTDHPYEAEISQFCSSSKANTTSDARNHCVPIYDVLVSPLASNIIFLVMPFLNTYNHPRFSTVGEAVECLKQLIEGLQFMHLHRVAHRDIKTDNIMMDASGLISEPRHPAIPAAISYDGKRWVKYTTRTRRPVKYYYIDFGISRKYDADCISPREPPIWGGVKTVPEFLQSDEPRDPFPTDIYYLGNLFREDFVQKSAAFDFLQPLVADMVQDDPAKRPTIDEVAERFGKLCASLGAWKLRSRMVHRKDSSVAGFFRTIRHVYRTLEYVVTRKPAMPAPPA